MARTNRTIGRDGSKAVGVRCCAAQFERASEATAHEARHMHLTPELLAAVAEEARQGWDAQRIAEALNGQPIEQAWDVDVEQVATALDVLEQQQQEERGR